MSQSADARRAPPSIRESLQEYGRGLAGGLLFSLPLLYTMEVWWAGFIAHPYRLIGLLAFTFVLLLGYNRFAGLREDASWLEVAIDSVEELGLGVVTATAVLYLLDRIGPGRSFDETLGKIVVEAAVVAIGFSVGTAQLHDGDEEQKGIRGDTGATSATFVSSMVIAWCGAILFASHVAPTEEIVMIAVEASPGRILALVVVSIVMGSVILHFSNFRGSGGRSAREDWWSIVSGSTISYAIALAASAVILWFFGRFTGVSLEIAVAQTVVLAFPASLGASAGRFLLA